MKNTNRRKIPGLGLEYEAGEDGNIYRLPIVYKTSFRGKPVTRPLPEKILAGCALTAKGYKRVNIGGRTYFVHRLIALAFIPNPEALPQVNHKNGVKSDNRPENLEWVTNQQNRDHSVAIGTQARGSKVSKRLDEKDVVRIRAFLAAGISQKVIGKAFGVCWQTIWHIHRRSTWKHV